MIGEIFSFTEKNKTNFVTIPRKIVIVKCKEQNQKKSITMKSYNEINEFVTKLRYKRMTKSELEKTLSDFFQSKIELVEEPTDDDDSNVKVDYVLSVTTSVVDIDIYYLKTREKDKLLITDICLSNWF